MSKEVPDKPTLEELEVRLRELELENQYQLSRTALLTEQVQIGGCMVIGGLVLVFSSVVALLKDWLSGNHVVAIVAILAVTILLYFALVFGRQAKIHTEISKLKKQLKLEIGKKVK